MAINKCLKEECNLISNGICSKWPVAPNRINDIVIDCKRFKLKESISSFSSRDVMIEYSEPDGDY